MYDTTIYREWNMNTKEIRQFREILRKFERVTSFQVKSCCSGVTLAQCHALMEIDSLSGKATTVQLARNLNLDKSTLSRTIDGLIDLGLVERLPHPSDRRFFVIALTKQGRTTCDGFNRSSDAYYKGVFQNVPEKKQRTVVEHFDLLVQAFVKYEHQHNKDAACCGTIDNPEKQKNKGG